jgi:hypothetical protein
VDAVLSAIGQLQQLHTLRLRVDSREAVSFAALQQLPLLRALDLIARFPNVNQSATELRALSRLQRVYIHMLDAAFDGARERCAAFLNALLGDAHEAQLRALLWREVHIIGDITDDSAPLLCRLPLLEHLEADLSDCSSFEFLAALPRLTTLQLRMWEPEYYAFANLLAVFTSDGLVRLRTLHLHGAPCHDDHPVQLLLRLPMLQRLAVDLARCTQFAFLTALPQLAHLELHLWYMDGAAWPMLLAVFTSDGLARLHELVLHCGPCSSDDLFLLLSHTPFADEPRARRFGIRHVAFLFCQLPQLAQSLTQLTLECTATWRLTAADLPPLLVLQQLRELRLLDWPEEAPVTLTDADRAPFKRRPCIVLPHLNLFQWTTLER